MFTSPLLGFLVEAFHVVLQLLAIDAPDPAASDLYRRQFAGANKRVHLGHADAEVGRHIVEGEEAGFDLDLAVTGGAIGVLGHRPKIAADHVGYLHLASFAAVWRNWDADWRETWR